MLALSNTRANSFLFINLELTTLLICHCGVCLKPLLHIILVTGYNGKNDLRITHYVHLTLQINNY